MRSVTSAELQKRFGRYREKALREPIAITNHGRESLVLLSAEEFRRLKQRDREALFVWELEEDDLKALTSAQSPEESACYDDEVTS